MGTEKRLIDARYLTSQMYLICEACQTENIFIDAIIDEIDNAPDVDAVEVVHCENCVNHGNCLPEDVFRIARIEKPYCCAGKKDGERNA